MISVAALCLIAGLAPPEIAAIFNPADGQVCEKAGVVPVDAEKLPSQQSYLVSQRLRP